MVSLHKLFSEWMRQSFDYETAQRIARDACRLISRAIVHSQEDSESGNLDIQNFQKQLLPHIRVYLQWAEDIPEIDVEWGPLAKLFLEQGRLTEAAQLYRLALKTTSLYAEHRSRVTPLLGLGHALLQRGNISKNEAEFAEAETVVKEAISNMSQTHEDVANPLLRVDALHLYASILIATGKFCKAEEIYHTILYEQEKNLGTDHLETLRTLSMLASGWRERGDTHAAAEVLYRRVVASYARTLGPDHLMTFEANLDLALICQEQGKLAEADDLYRVALDAMRSKLGKEHPNTLKAKARRAIVLDMQGDYDMARVHYKEAIEGMKKVMGESHPEVLKIKENEALSFRLSGEYDEAEKLYLEVLSTMKKHLAIYPQSAVEKTAMKLSEMYKAQDNSAERIKAAEKRFGLVGLIDGD
jgi:tetratricopeptide (TPR) repeat protein